MPGIAGHKARRVQEWRYEVPAGARIVLHSDGLTDKWQSGPTLLYPGSDPRRRRR